MYLNLFVNTTGPVYIRIGIYPFRKVIIGRREIDGVFDVLKRMIEIDENITKDAAKKIMIKKYIGLRTFHYLNEFNVLLCMVGYICH